MKIYYLNDEQRPMPVYYHYGLSGPAAVLGPAEGAYFDIKVPRGAIPFVKKWKDYVMVSYTQKGIQGKVFKSTGKPEWERKNPSQNQE